MTVIRDREYIYFDDYKVLGEFQSHYAKREHDNSPLMPVLSVKWIKNQQHHQYILTPGHFDIEGKFYPSPVLIHYCQLLAYVQKEDYTEKFYGIKEISFDFRLFSKDFIKSRRMNMTFNQSTNSSFDWTSFDRVINLLNIYVDRNYNIELLNIENLNYDNFILKDKAYVIDCIDKITLEFFENCKSKPGGDNLYWEEIEVYNLPDDRYLRKIICEWLGNQFYIIEDKKDHLIMEIHPHDYCLDSFKRRKQTGDFKERINGIKDSLIFDIGKYYDSYDQLFDKIT